MSKPSSYTIHITYSASSNKKPSSHQGQGKLVLSSVLYTGVWCIFTRLCLLTNISVMTVVDFQIVTDEIQ